MIALDLIILTSCNKFCVSLTSSIKQDKWNMYEMLLAGSNIMQDRIFILKNNPIKHN